MTAKLFEVMDRHTCIGVLAVQAISDQVAERFLLHRTGYADFEPMVILVRLELRGKAVQADYDPFAWSDSGRTLYHAHNYIASNWDKLDSGTVIDVEFILGEKDAPKMSERLK